MHSLSDALTYSVQSDDIYPEDDPPMPNNSGPLTNRKHRRRFRALSKQRIGGLIMSGVNAFGRLFPPSLFSILGVIMSVIWRPDPVLMGIGACAAGAAAAWLIVTTVVVAKSLPGQASIHAAPDAMTSKGTAV
jgi:hypothetical protein